MLTYQYDPTIVHIQETANEKDVEFQIRILQEHPYAENLKLVQKEFEENGPITDVLFYPLINHEFTVIVRQDYYADFVLELMKRQLLTSVQWTTT